MNFRNALGFLMVGVVLRWLPDWAPASCSNGAGGSARLIWLQLMSTLQIGLAATYFLRRACTGLAGVLAWVPATAPTEFALERRTAVSPRLVAVPSPVRLGIARIRPRRTTVLELPVAAFEAALLEQRPAA